MNKEDKRLIVQARLMQAYAEIGGMTTENLQRIHRGESLAHHDADFFTACERFECTPGQVQRFLEGGMTGAEMIVCPFCEEKDFDLVGLKCHLENYCDEFKSTPGPWSKEAV